MRRLASPLAAPAGGGYIFTTVDECENDAPLCKRWLVVATANDADGDEIPDQFDNCPTVPNPAQEDVCGHVQSCGDGIVTPPFEICDDGSPADGGDANDRCLNCTKLCGPTPRADCHAAGVGSGASIVLKHTSDGGGSLTFRWLHATATKADFGNPLRTASYALCIYDASEAVQPLVEAHALAGSSCSTGTCWKGRGGRSFRYTNHGGGGGLRTSLSRPSATTRQGSRPKAAASRSCRPACRSPRP